MKKFFSYIGALFIAAFGIWVVGRSRTHRKQVATLEDKKVKELEGKSAGALKKANVLTDKIDVKLDKAESTKTTAEAIAKKLEDRNETSLANRVRDFNDSL